MAGKKDEEGDIRGKMVMGNEQGRSTEEKGMKGEEGEEERLERRKSECQGELFGKEARSEENERGETHADKT
ncbi:hypothetical protein E2C01_071202 [Portunus trituberculatus]|uniref:Uncharacterized protein n=1 Tax=Portunus trituberculatus TaxID=210409 RepID=A0A5B7HWD0_PORTR|nr:hypothetical protein [Portunus trituberculatus]